jgi:hypothetical protein
VRGEHHLTNAFEDLDLLLHGPWLSVGVGRGCGGVDGLAGAAMSRSRAEGPGPATNAQVECHPARDQADVRADGRCAGDGSTRLVACVSRWADA